MSFAGDPPFAINDAKQLPSRCLVLANEVTGAQMEASHSCGSLGIRQLCHDKAAAEVIDPLAVRPGERVNLHPTSMTGNQGLAIPNDGGCLTIIPGRLRT